MVLPNVWLGVSVEDQRRADERIPLLLDTPAAIRWVSAEPLLGPVRLHERLGDDWLASGLSGEQRGLDWIVIGGESGPGARPFDISWARVLVAQCKAARTPVFMKQVGSWAGEVIDGVWHSRTYKHKGGDPAEWSEDLRVREYPAQERA